MIIMSVFHTVVFFCCHICSFVVTFILFFTFIHQYYFSLLGGSFKGGTDICSPLIRGCELVEDNTEWGGADLLMVTGTYCTIIACTDNENDDIDNVIVIDCQR